jgi:hypothetical protein
MEQAEAMLARLEALGLDLGGIEEVAFGSGPFAIDYQGETRRSYLIGGMNVGMLVERYAKYPVEVADRITLDECSASA